MTFTETPLANLHRPRLVTPVSTSCAVCGMGVKTVPGGEGPTLIHVDGHVLGYGPDLGLHPITVVDETIASVFAIDGDGTLFYRVINAHDWHRVDIDLIDDDLAAKAAAALSALRLLTGWSP